MRAADHLPIGAGQVRDQRVMGGLVGAGARKPAKIVHAIKDQQMPRP